MRSQSLDAGPQSFDVGQTYLAAMQAFVSAVKERRPASPDLAEGLASTALALKARSALAQAGL